ncbi:MAG: hypothetical protein IPH45_03315 [Bacteroidales bacterium]|nr:hypothetical protein [Bacteroidales bacterium]
MLKAIARADGSRGRIQPGGCLPANLGLKTDWSIEPQNIITPMAKFVSECISVVIVLLKVKYLDTLGHVTQKGGAKRLYTPSEIRYCWDGEWKFYDEKHKLYRTALYRKGEEVTFGTPANE